MGVARCGLSLTPPVMCEHMREWHQATPMFSTFGTSAARMSDFSRVIIFDRFRGIKRFRFSKEIFGRGARRRKLGRSVLHFYRAVIGHCGSLLPLAAALRASVLLSQGQGHQGGSHGCCRVLLARGPWASRRWAPGSVRRPARIIARRAPPCSSGVTRVHRFDFSAV